MNTKWIQDNAIWVCQRLIEMAQSNRKCGNTKEANAQATYAMNLYVGNVTYNDLYNIATYFEPKEA